MKNFIQYSIKLITTTGLFLLILQIVISIRIEGESINGQDNLDQITNLNKDLICIGASRCLTSFMPSVFQKNGISIVNLGLHGQSSLKFAHLRFEDYCDRNSIKPKVVVLTVDAYSYVKKEENLFMKDRFARYAFMPKNKNLKFLNYFGFNLLERFVPSYALLKYRKIWNGLFLNNQSQWLSIGMETQGSSICNRISDFPEHELKAAIRLKKLDYDLIHELNKLNHKFKKYDVKFIVVQIPIYELLYNNRFKETRLICDKAGVECIDLAIEKYNKDCSLFNDLNHLNTKGARIISDTVATYLKSNDLIYRKSKERK